LFEKSLSAFFRAKIILLAVQPFFEGIFLGNIGVAHFVFDHDPGKLTGRAVSSSLPLRWKKKAENKVDKVGDKSVKDESKKTRYHSLNVAHLAGSVKPTKFLILGFPKSKMKKDCFQRRRDGFSIH
jgi:hypothetical protein